MLLVKKNTTGNSVKLLQKLLRDTGYTLRATGKYNAVTEAAVMHFQTENDLESDGIVFTKTWSKLLLSKSAKSDNLQKKLLSEKDIAKTAAELNLEPALVKTVIAVESNGSGFLADGRPKILFEGHIFWNELKKRNIPPQSLSDRDTGILYPKWTKQFYKGGTLEYERLERAIRLSGNAAGTEAALCSASWGLFQIMGFHYAALGYDSVIDFAGEMKLSEGNQLHIFSKFLMINNLVGLLQKKRWAEFARRYNGSGYKQNKYDEKLEKAYAAFSK